MTVCGITSLLYFTAPEIMLASFSARTAQTKSMRHFSPFNKWKDLYGACRKKAHIRNTVKFFSEIALRVCPAGYCSVNHV